MGSSDPVDTVRVVRTRAEHNVSRKHMDPDALRVLYRLSRSGFTAYLVGGGVRDLLLGRRPKDFDVATNAHPRDIRKLFRNSFLIGRRFRLVHVRFGDNVIETSTFRRRPEAEPAGEDESLYVETDNTFGTPEEDAGRRDFTVNALFYDIESYSIIDHVGGLDDLDRRLIRSIGNPDERFQEDPVRMVRAVRFAARLGFEIERGTYAAIIRHHDKLAQAAPPRMLEEIYKLFPYGSAEAAFHLLRKTRLLAVMFPELDEFLDRGGPETPRFWKYLAGLDRRAVEGPMASDPSLIFATLLLAPYQESLKRESREVDFARHASTARVLLDPIAERYRMPKRVYFRTILLLDGLRRFDGPAERARRRFVTHEAFSDMLELRCILGRALGERPQALAGWFALRDEAAREMGPRGGHAPRSEGADGESAGGRRRPRGGARRRRGDGPNPGARGPEGLQGGEPPDRLAGEAVDFA